jgi:hypothetical protein
MIKFKIIKQVHTYNQNMTKYVVYNKSFLCWIPANNTSSHFKYQYDSYFEAEMSIIDYFETKHGGIISIDSNVYTYSPYSLSLP